jgi:outer membrane protein
MNSVPRRESGSSCVLAVASLVVMLSGSLPLTAFAQEGVVPRQQIAKTQEKSANASAEAPKDQQTDAKPAASASQQEQKPQNLITQPLAMSPEVTKVRVGIKEGQQESLTMQNAIALALKNNLDIEMARQDVSMAQYSLFGSRGVYDPLLGSAINYTSQTVPVTSVTQLGGGAESLTSRQVVYNFSLDHMLERTGTKWGLDFNNRRSSSNSSNDRLSPNYSPALSVSVTQPLMRNFKIDSFRQSIQLAKRSLDISDSQFRQMVINIISSVQQAYWDLVFAIRNERVARDSVELTRTQLGNNQKMVEAGTLAPIELRSTEAALESRKGTVISALQQITTAENALKARMIKDPNDKIWYSEIVPLDEPQMGQTTLSLEDLTTVALKNRPELDQLRFQVEQNQINQKFYQNQLKPQVDLVGFFTTTGTAGKASQQVVDPTSPFPISTVQERFRGGYFQALRNLGTFDFPIYQFGVSISFPWRNRTVEGNLGRSLAESRRLDARQRQLVQMVQIDVRNALQAVEATRQRHEAAKASRIAAEAQLNGEQERFRAGLSSNFLVLQRQNDFAIAQADEVRAQTDFNKALAELQRVTGMTLVSNNVEVKPPPNDVK